MAVFLLVFAAVLGAYGAVFFPWGLLLWYPALSGLILSAAYACNRPGWIGKRADGRLAEWAWCVHGSYFAFRHAVWHAQLAISSEPAVQEVVPGLWLARRLKNGELPPGIAWGALVDLTAEFQEPNGMTVQAGWRCIPVLDAGVPTPAALARWEPLVAQAGPILIHCAQGHGRTGMLAAWLLLRRGQAKTVAEALSQIQSVRPGARLKKCQIKWLERRFATFNVR